MKNHFWLHFFEIVDKCRCIHGKFCKTRIRIQIRLLSARQIIHNINFHTLRNKRIYNMRTNKSGAAGNKSCFEFHNVIQIKKRIVERRVFKRIGEDACGEPVCGSLPKGGLLPQPIRLNTPSEMYVKFIPYFLSQIDLIFQVPF